MCDQWHLVKDKLHLGRPQRRALWSPEFQPDSSNKYRNSRKVSNNFFLSAQSILNGDIKKCNSMTDSSRNLVDSRRDIFGSLISPPEGWNLWLKKTRASHLAQLRVVNHQGETRGSKVNGSDPTLPSLSGFSLVYIWHKNQGFKIAFLQVPCDSSLDPDSTKGLISEAKKKRIFSWDDFQKLLLAAQISLWKCRTCWERQQHPPL